MRDPDERVGVLLVDDRRDKLLALETILGDLDERLVTVTSGEDALRALLKEDFAVIVLDVNMPGMDGFETASTIRQRKRTEHTPIIFVTGINVNETHVTRGYELGAVDYIFTPVDPVILRSKVSVFTDLYRRADEIKRKEEVLRLAAEKRAASIQSRLEGLLNRLNVGVFQIDHYGRCLDCNPAFLSAVGAESKADLDRINLSWILDQVNKGLTAEVAVKVPRADGKTLWVSLSTTDGVVDGVPVIEGVIEDVTASRGAEEALRQSELRYRSLIEALPQLVWTADSAGKWDYVSRQWCEYTGLDELRHLSDRWSELLCPEEAERVLARWTDSVATGAVYDAEHHIRGKDGNYRWFKCRGVPILDDHGRVMRWLGTCTDMEEQKQAEAALEATSRLKDEFLTMLSHELRNPLNAISSAVQVALRKPTPETNAWSNDVVKRQVKQLVRLIDDLLDVSRVSQGKIRLKAEPIKLEELIKNAEISTSTLIEKREHAIHRSGPTDAVIQGDPARLQQIIVNLLTNAAKYTEKGGSIWLTTAVTDDDVEIAVRDSGVGIAPEMLPKIFDLFLQIDRSLDRSQGGLGIGLTVARKLAELHGGTLTASSDGIGQGATFTLRLPRALNSSDLVSVSNLEVRLPARLNVRVLLVDDHVDTLDGTALFLEELGCSVKTCADGALALAAVREFKPEVVLLDIGLPGLNGYEVANLIRNDPAVGKVVLVAVSGYGQEQDRKRSSESGFDLHMVKPLNLELLFPALVPLLRSSRTDTRQATASN